MRAASTQIYDLTSQLKLVREQIEALKLERTGLAVWVHLHNGDVEAIAKGENVDND